MYTFSTVSFRTWLLGMVWARRKKKATAGMWGFMLELACRIPAFLREGEGKMSEGRFCRIAAIVLIVWGLTSGHVYVCLIVVGLLRAAMQFVTVAVYANLGVCC